MSVFLRYFLGILFLVSCPTLQAQDVPRLTLIGIGTGVDLVQNRDLSVSPLQYKGFGLPVAFRFVRKVPRFSHYGELRLIMPEMTNAYALRSAANTELNAWYKIDLSWKSLKTIGKNHLAGGGIQSRFMLREYNFLDGFGWEWQSAFSLEYAYKLRHGTKSLLTASLSLPVFAFIHRKHSLTLDEDFLYDWEYGGTARLLHYGKFRPIFSEWFAFETALLYSLNFSEHWNFSAKAGLFFYQMSYPEKVRTLNLPLLCFIHYRL